MARNDHNTNKQGKTVKVYVKENVQSRAVNVTYGIVQASYMKKIPNLKEMREVLVVEPIPEVLPFHEIDLFRESRFCNFTDDESVTIHPTNSNVYVL